ncbi:MAG TPA: hypothetical protein VNT03_15590 [Baekduia sp.]|nr:hypothetical protein [Baekduia sp.]
MNARGGVVCCLAVPHDPTLPTVLANRGSEELVASVASFLEHQRNVLRASGAEALVVVAGDHLNQWFLDNMPAFMLGKAPSAQGPFPDEAQVFGIETLELETDGELARRILREGFEQGVDWAYSDEYVLDHAFTVPLGLVRPENDLPVVPIFTNVLAPPVPTARRFYEVGAVVRRAIDTWTVGRRVGVIVTGHLTNNVGGPRFLDFMREPISAWDRHMWELVERWDVERIIEESSWDRLNEAGHATPAFLDVIFGIGVAHGARPTRAEIGGAGIGPTFPLMSWDEEALRS